MAKYIKQAEIIPTLHQDTKYGTYEECMDGSLCTFTMNEIDNFIKSMPTIEIVHCGECYFYPRCREGISLSPDWFCADGERKKDE